MSAARTEIAGQPVGIVTPLFSALFLAFSVLTVLRIGLNSRLLDLFMDYTADGGLFVEKIHPTFWGFSIVAVISLISFRLELTAWELRVARAMLAFCATAFGLLVIGTVTGRSSSLGYLLDTYVTLIVTLLLFVFPAPWRQRLGALLIGYLILSALIGILEFASHIRLMPFTEGETVFRPTGLTNHPLEFGQWCTLALCFVAGTNWPRALKSAIGAMLIVACVLSGARLATIVMFLCTVVLLLTSVNNDIVPRLRAQRWLLMILAVLLIGPALVGGLFALGALTRFDGGIADDNAMSRVDVYGILGLLSWNQLLLGGDIETVRKLIQERYDYASIESSFLVFLVQFGLIGTIVFLGMMARLARAILSGASGPTILAFLSFFVIALSNNGLSVKSSSIFLLIILGIAFHPAETPPERSLET